MPKQNKKTLITIVCERILEENIVEDLHAYKISGHTIWDSRGEGSRGRRQNDWDQMGNICIQVVCSQEKALQVTQGLFEVLLGLRDYHLFIRGRGSSFGKVFLAYKHSFIPWGPNECLYRKRFSY